MTQGFQDRFDRADSIGSIGTEYLIPCGFVSLLDQSVLPVRQAPGQSGLSPIFEGGTEEKAQVLYVEEDMDGPDYVVRAVWSHDPAILGERALSELLTLTRNDPSFSLLVRMEKDPMLIDLGRAQEPACWDQGYGLRITCPRSGAAPVLKLVKYMPAALPPGIQRPASTEEDGAQVLTSITLQSANLNLDPNWDETGDFPYQGFVQEMRLRVRRADERVILEAFLNDRNMHTPVLEYTDQQDPLWGTKGRPGFEFISAILNTQPAGTSPFAESALPVMRCDLFQVQTIKDFRRPTSVQPENLMTYDRIVDHVITIVERDGDGHYTGTEGGVTKRATYLNFVVAAESHIIREVGHYHWLRRSANVHMADSRENYELPSDCGMVELIRPSWQGVPLSEAPTFQFHNRLAGITQTAGRPRIYEFIEESVNNRKRIRVFPVPTLAADADPEFLIIEYYSRQVYPSEPDIQLPFVPQDHWDVLAWGAAAHALLVDTDDANAKRVGTVFAGKLKGLKRDEYRKGSGMQSVARSAADVHRDDRHLGSPLLRAGQLETLLLF